MIKRFAFIVCLFFLVCPIMADEELTHTNILKVRFGWNYQLDTYLGNYCFIEWPEMIEPLLPEDTVWVKIVPQENGDRLLRIEND